MALVGALLLVGSWWIPRPCSATTATATTTTAAEWNLVYEEDFSSKRVLSNADSSRWEKDDFEKPFDTIMDDNGIWYENDYGPAAFRDALNSFHTYRKEFRIGTDGWLTASLSARDRDKDGDTERREPLLHVETTLNGKKVLTMDVMDHTGGVILRPTSALPDEYRIEYKLCVLDFGGKRDGSIEYDGRINGYSKEGCKTQHPWAEGSNSRGWSGDASEPYCRWQDVREGPYGYNGFQFLAIVDFADPAPRNNHFWHYKRKMFIDSFSQHPDRVGYEPGRVCNSETGEYYDYRDSSFNTVNMLFAGLPGSWQPDPGGLVSNSQRFVSSCNGGIATEGLESAAEITPELLRPGEYYRFAIERNSTGYTLEASGNFARAGQKTLRFFRPFVVDGEPIWHYNVKPTEYDGQYNNDLKQLNWAHGSTTWEDQWPAGSAYPDYFLIGVPYTNVYEGKASLTDVRLFEPANKVECNPTVVLRSNEVISAGETIVGETMYATQHENGNLEIRTGTPENPGYLVWENGVDEPTEEFIYYTILQGDSHLITWRGNPDNSGRSVAWKSGTVNTSGDYFFVIECRARGGGVAIYSTLPEEGGYPLWKQDPLSTPPTPEGVPERLEDLRSDTEL